MEVFFNKVVDLNKKRTSSQFHHGFFLKCIRVNISVLSTVLSVPDTEQYSEKSFQKSSENNSNRVLFFSEVAGF